jgi:hypothetical protein
VLVAGLAADEALPYERALHEVGFSTELIPDPSEAASLLEERRFSAVVAGHPLAPGALGTMLSVMRGRSNVNASTGLVLLARPEGLRGASSLVGRGVTRALSRAEAPSVLAVVVNRIVEFGSPTVERFSVRQQVSLRSRPEPLQTDDLSGTGMLVQDGHEPPPIGSLHDFELELPEGLVSGQLRVVRHTASGRDPVRGFGARFTVLDGSGQSMLDRYLQGLGKARSSTS